MRNKQRSAAIILSLLMAWMGLAASGASAAMVDTASVIHDASVSEQKAALKDALPIRKKRITPIDAYHVKTLHKTPTSTQNTT